MTFKELSKRLNTSIQTVQNLVQVLSTAFNDIEEGGGGGESEYIAEETEIGTFLEGTLYRQVIAITDISLSNNQEVTIAAVGTGIIPRKIIGCGNENGIWYQIPEYGIRLTYNSTTGNLDIKSTGGSWTLTEGYIIFEYEKEQETVEE